MDRRIELLLVVGHSIAVLAEKYNSESLVFNLESPF